MLGLPHSTEVNSRETKEKIYANTTLSPQLRNVIKNQIKSIYWRNKLAESTMGIGVGEDIKEIHVFEIQLRQKELDKRILSAIARVIKYKILFLLVYKEGAQAWMEVFGTFYNTEWQSLDCLALKFEGMNLDAVYENLARQISGGRLGSEGDIKEAVDRDKKRQKLERDIVALEKKLLREKQLNKQVELNCELKRLKAELEDIQ
jgi:hypothetical protein